MRTSQKSLIQLSVPGNDKRKSELVVNIKDVGPIMQGVMKFLQAEIKDWHTEEECRALMNSTLGLARVAYELGRNSDDTL